MHEKEPDLTKKHLIWSKSTWTQQTYSEGKNLRSVRLELIFDIQRNLEVVWLSLLLVSNIFILTITYTTRYRSILDQFSKKIMEILRWVSTFPLRTCVMTYFVCKFSTVYWASIIAKYAPKFVGFCFFLKWRADIVGWNHTMQFVVFIRAQVFHLHIFCWGQVLFDQIRCFFVKSCSFSYMLEIFVGFCCFYVSVYLFKMICTPKSGW